MRSAILAACSKWQYSFIWCIKLISWMWHWLRNYSSLEERSFVRTKFSQGKYASSIHPFNAISLLQHKWNLNAQSISSCCWMIFCICLNVISYAASNKRCGKPTSTGGRKTTTKWSWWQKHYCKQESSSSFLPFASEWTGQIFAGIFRCFFSRCLLLGRHTTMKWNDWTSDDSSLNVEHFPIRYPRCKPRDPRNVSFVAG